MGVRRTLGLVAFVAVVALAACGSDDPGEVPQSSTTAAATADPSEPANSAPARFDVPDGFDFSREACVSHFGHPCRRSEYDPAVKGLQAEYANAVSQLMANESREAAFQWISTQEGVIDSHFSDNRIMFQVVGAMPFSIITPIPEPPPGFGDDVEALATLRPADSPTAQLVSNRMRGVPTLAAFGVVGEGTARENKQNKKNALFLEPWAADEGSLLNVTAARADVRGALKEIHDYSDIDSVVHVPDANADPAWFTSDIWAQYDFIYVSTHGDVSPNDAVLESGARRVFNTGDDETAVCDDLLAPYEDLIGVVCGIQKPLDGPEYRTVDMTDIFFFAQYFNPNRQLEKAIVYIEACRSLLHPILSAHIVGNSSAYFGWTDYINLNRARELSGALMLQLTDRHRPAGVALKTLCDTVGCGGERYRDPKSQDDPHLELHDNGPEPKKLRLYDVPVIQDSTAFNNILENGAELEIRGIAGDGNRDQLEITVELTGVIDPEDTSDDFANIVDLGPPATLYDMIFYVNDEEIGADNLGNAMDETAEIVDLGDSKYRYRYVANLPFDVAPDGSDVTLKVVVNLPETGISDYEVDVKLVEPTTGTTVTVGGQTWEFELEPSIGGCLVGEEGVFAAGTIVGDPFGVLFNAHVFLDGSGEITVQDPNGDWEWMAAADREHMTVLHLVPDGNSQINTIDFEGNVVSGTATFINTDEFIRAWQTNAAFPNGVSGEFEILCPGPVIVEDDGA